jgi:ESCRT-II complex subunit VPS25
VEATRAKQLALWRELILKYHTEKRIKVLRIHDCPLWRNPSIDRRLDAEEIQMVIKDFCQSGHGEPIDEASVRILWRKPAELATDIYTWADSHGLIGSVCTIFELHSGEDVQGMSFQGVDEDLLRRALKLLEDQGKCAIFKGDTSDEDGIKFM